MHKKFYIAVLVAVVLSALVVPVASAQWPVYSPPVYVNPYGYTSQGLSYELRYSVQRSVYDFNYARTWATYQVQSAQNQTQLYQGQLFEASTLNQVDPNNYYNYYNGQ